jgi:hypothetical protein
VPGTLLDLERVVATDGKPRQPGRAQVVPREQLSVCVALVQLGAVHPCPCQPEAEVSRHVPVAEAHDVPLPARLGVQRLK